MLNSLSPGIILALIAAYFVLLMTISWFTGRKADNDSFFLANRKSPWFLVAFGMIGASLSGVTFISIPGVVGAEGLNMNFSYLQVVLGYLVGYVVIALVLLPLYYRLGITSIYQFLEQRFGFFAYKTGSAFFLLSRTIGASFRLFLVAIVLQEFVLGPFGVPFWVTVLTAIMLIWTYTFRGGIKTIVWTDTLQTISMLLAVILTIFGIGNALDLDLAGMIALVSESDLSNMFYFSGGWSDPNNFFKQFLAGMFITIVMTGLDQDMMQKNLTCKNLKEAQLNMFSFSGILIFANLLFLFLGALLYLYSNQVGLEIPSSSDNLFPMVALQHLKPWVGIAFVIGLIAAAYSSADSALTSLTTAFCVDFLGFTTEDQSKNQKRRRFMVHLGFSFLLFIVILLFKALNNDAVINGLFKAAGYTYGPLLGLFAFGIFSKKRKLRGEWVIPVCILAPILTFILQKFSTTLFFGYQFGFELLILNGLLTFFGLAAISYYPVEEE
ncbi:MAG: sodium:solute symporter [Saprospiraceae bacterium]|nr:sodium:solute symporter [Saprospiraceae bacterium]